jgi:hypothetical protein
MNNKDFIPISFDFSYKKLGIFHREFVIYGLKQANEKNVHIHGI